VKSNHTTRLCDNRAINKLRWKDDGGSVYWNKCKRDQVMPLGQNNQSLNTTYFVAVHSTSTILWMT
jgi:hypothetical protein